MLSPKGGKSAQQSRHQCAFRCKGERTCVPTLRAQTRFLWCSAVLGLFLLYWCCCGLCVTVVIFMNITVKNNERINYCGMVKRTLVLVYRRKTLPGWSVKHIDSAWPCVCVCVCESHGPHYPTHLPTYPTHCGRRISPVHLDIFTGELLRLTPHTCWGRGGGWV